MLEPDQEITSRHNPKWQKPSIVSCLVSLFSVIFTQFSLSLIPLFLPTSSIIYLLPIAALVLVVVMGLGRLCKRVAGVRASAPAFVFFSIFSIWAVYIYVVRQVTSSLLDIVMNAEIIMLLVGLFRIISLDPGIVTHHSYALPSLRNSIDEVESQEEELEFSTFVEHQEYPPAEETIRRHSRVRYCRYCNNYIRGFDHHCPAFGNCIGQRNHALFLVLVVGFAITEASFVVCASQFTAKSQTSTEVRIEAMTSRNLVFGTALFCLIQVIWQVVFIIWHVYCACFNIKTDEWINWKKYPEFHSQVISHDGQPHPDVRFINPYDKGILQNLKEFCAEVDVFHHRGPRRADSRQTVRPKPGQGTSYTSNQRK